MLDPALRTRLETVCRECRSRLYLPAGALGGLDALAAAAVGALDEVTLRIVEPGDAEQVILCVDALDGAQQFPARLNIAVAASLAAARGVQVELSQQRVDRREIELTARGAFGDMRIHLNLRPAPNRVSHIVALANDGLIFDDPEVGWQTADAYLSGNVKRKLATAERAAVAESRFPAQRRGVATRHPR